MIAAPLDDLRRRASALARMRSAVGSTSVDVRSTVGGGSLPGETLPSVGDRCPRWLGGETPRCASARHAGGHRPHRGRARRPRPADRRPPDADRGARPGGRRRHQRMTLVVGTAGHIDHGKTTLLRALTGIDADRLPEERRRGMTIDVGYAHLDLDDGSSIDFVDVPGHDRLVGNMLVGAGEIDAVAAGRRGRRRPACPDARAPGAARRARGRTRAGRRDEDRRGAARARRRGRRGGDRDAVRRRRLPAARSCPPPA